MAASGRCTAARTTRPALESDAPAIDTPDEIAALLKECEVGEVRRLPGILSPDWLRRLRRALLPDPAGEMVHAELPEDAETAPTHFH